MRLSFSSIGFALLLVALSLQAGDLRINVLDGTNGGPGTADHVAILDLGMGMVELSGADMVKGATTLSGIVSDAQKQYLVRAIKAGETYSAMFIPDPKLSAWETSITVYDTGAEMQNVQASVPYFVIYAIDDHLYIQKRYILENLSQPPVTFYKPPGIIPVHVPDNITELDYLTIKHGTMPLKTQPLPLDGRQVLPNALKPGTSEIDIAYTVPYDPSGSIVTEEVGFDIPHFHVYSMPMDLKVSAPGLTAEGTDQENGLAIWALENVAAGTSLKINISGASMHEGDTEQEQPKGSGRIVIEHRVPLANKLVLGGVLALLIIIALFYSIAQQQNDLKAESIQMLRDQQHILLKKYAKLAEADATDPEVDRVLHQLISVYKTLHRIA